MQITRLRGLLGILFVVALIATIAVKATEAQGIEAAAVADVTTVRSQIVAFYTAAGASRSDARVISSLRGIESAARTYSAAGYLRADGSWSDLDYAQVPSGSWSPWEHFRRIMTMARAYSTPGQALYRNAALRTSLESSIAYIDVFYGKNVQTIGNWWFWDIGPALDLGPALVLVGSDLNPNVFANAVETLRYRVGIAPGMSGTGSLLTGQNLVWSSINHLMLAVLTNDEKRLAMVRDRLASAATVSSGEGIKRDLSFHQHGAQLYTGSYGAAFAYEMSKYLLFARGTMYELPSASTTSFTNYVADGIRTGIYRNHFDVSLIGREVSRPSASGFNGLAALLQMSIVPSPRENEIRGSAAAMLATWDEGMAPEHAGLAASLSGVAAATPVGFRAFPDSDYVIQRRPGWFASIRMFSTRTKSGESTNGESLLGSRQSDGRLHLVVRGDEYDNLWPTIDWSRLPGITVEQKAGAADANYGTGTTTFVGGVSGGTRGVAAMRLAPLGSTLTARKSWFFFDDAVFFLGSSIASTSTNPVETIIDQRPLRETSMVVDGSFWTPADSTRVMTWAHADGIGYFFPTPSAVHATQAEQRGNWINLAVTSLNQEVSARVRTLRLDHGTRPANQSFEYAIVPAIDRAAMAQWAAERPITVLANTDRVAAVRDKRSSTTGYVFWSPASAQGISVDRASIVMVTDDGPTRRIVVADPTFASARVRITMAGRFQLPAEQSGVTLVSAGSTTTTLEIAMASGRGTEATLRALVSRPRLVRR